MNESPVYPVHTSVFPNIMIVEVSSWTTWKDYSARPQTSPTRGVFRWVTWAADVWGTVKHSKWSRLLRYCALTKSSLLCSRSEMTPSFLIREEHFSFLRQFFSLCVCSVITYYCNIACDIVLFSQHRINLWWWSI